MEITGPSRLHVSSSINVSIAGLRKLEAIALTEDQVGAKLAGCKATTLGMLLARVRPGVGNGVSGVIVASDGASTKPIAMSALVQAWLVHSDPLSADLPTSLGGPLRVIFPACAGITSLCGKSTPMSLKSAVRLDLCSEYELFDPAANAELSARAPRLILLLEENHSASLLAFARSYGGVGQPARVAISALDARGLTLRVTAADGAEVGDVLAAFPRPLSCADDVLPLVMQMHRDAYASIDLRFKLAAGYFTEPVRVAANAARRSPAVLVAITLACASVATAAVAFRRMR
jgi:hypothetical protein